MKNIITIAKVFSDKNRVDIFALLLRDGELCVCEICDTLSLSQPLVSRHLKQMKEAKILKTTQKKQWIFYSISKYESQMLECIAKELREKLPKLPKLIVCQRK